MKTTKEYQPKTGAKCSCKKGIERDNCTNCEGTGFVIDFKKIRETKKVITRDQYMDNASELHHEYYLQFATPGIKNFVDKNYSIETIKAALANDEHMNSPILNINGYGAPPTPGYNGSHWMSIFDHISSLYKHELSEVYFKINGVRGWSTSTGCCAIKAYMREKIK